MEATEIIKRMVGPTIAVKDLDAAVKKYEAFLGVKPQFLGPDFFAFPGHKGAYFRFGGNQITLITSDQPESSVGKFLATKGEGIFLLGFEVGNIERTTGELTSKGVKFISNKPVTFSNGKANFAHPKSMHGVQVEIAQLNQPIL